MIGQGGQLPLKGEQQTARTYNVVRFQECDTFSRKNIPEPRTWIFGVAGPRRQKLGVAQIQTAQHYGEVLLRHSVEVAGSVVLITVFRTFKS